MLLCRYAAMPLDHYLLSSAASIALAMAVERAEQPVPKVELLGWL